MRFKRFVIISSALFMFSGCALMAPVTPSPENDARPEGPLPPSTRPTYNLSGFPAASREGYIDGCETAKKTRYGQKDEVRYASDGQYQTGWNDGFDLCQTRDK